MVKAIFWMAIGAALILVPLSKNNPVEFQKITQDYKVKFSILLDNIKDFIKTKKKEQK